MASTFSPNLRLELIGTGEQQGTWGATTNTNLGTLLEEAIGGYVDVTVSNSGDTTLTTNNGSADQSRNMVLNLTGTISATRNVICPAIEKLYVVKNATTGGFAVTLKVSGQTGVSIPNGSTALLYVDGTDVRQVTGTISGQNANNVAITGGSITGITDLAIADGGTGASTAADAATNLGLGTGDSPQFTAVNIGNATDTTISRVSAGKIAVEGVNVALSTDIVGRETIWLPAVSMVSRTTNGAAAGSVETSTNKVMISTYDFDPTTQEFTQFAIQMPTGWNESTLLCQFLWSHPATTTNFGVAWQIQAAAFADNDGLDGLAFGTAVTVTDTGGTTNNLYITAESSAMTVAGSPTAGEYVVFQVARAPANASDTMAVDARLHGVRVIYTTDAAVDA